MLKYMMKMNENGYTLLDDSQSTTTLIPSDIPNVSPEDFLKLTTIKSGGYDPKKIIESLNMGIPSNYIQPPKVVDFRFEANTPAVITNLPNFGTAYHRDKVDSLKFIKTTRVLEFFESDVYYPDTDLGTSIYTIILDNADRFINYRDLLGFIEGDWIIFMGIEIPKRKTQTLP